MVRVKMTQHCSSAHADIQNALCRVCDVEQDLIYIRPYLIWPIPQGRELVFELWGCAELIVWMLASIY